MKQAIRMAGVAVIVGAMCTVPVVRATPLQINPELTMQGTGVSIAFRGVGLSDLGDGVASLSINVGGPVLKAFLYWAGREFPCAQSQGVCLIQEPYRDQEILFDGTLLTGAITGAEQASTQLWPRFHARNRSFKTGFVGGLPSSNVGYRADVTALVQAKGPGTHAFTIVDADPSNNFTVFDGAALLVYFVDPSDPAAYVISGYDGLDFAWGNAPTAESRTTQAVDFSYPASADPRLADLYVAVGDALEGRPDGIEITRNTPVTDQLNGSDGPDWDADTVLVIILAGESSTSVKVISPARFSDSDSLLWQLAVMRVPMPCFPGEVCDDGNACTVDDRCNQNGECVGLPIDPEVECADDNACTVDACDPQVGCVHSHNPGAACDDGNACTVADACDFGGECHGSPINPAVDCDDGNVCTFDACDQQIGCVNLVQQGAGCDDGNACTDDACDAQGRCIGTAFDPRVVCNDANVCTVESCNPVLGCLNTPQKGAPCNDNNACTTDECDATGLCVGTAIDPAVACDDGSACTLDECNPERGCTHIDINSLECNDLSDCPSAASACVTGHCKCDNAPDLCLEVVAADSDPAPGLVCVSGADQLFEVRVAMGFSLAPVCAAQFFLQYDVDALEFVSMSPGGGVFNFVLAESVNPATGTIDYVVGENPGAICRGARGPAVIATIVFRAVADCQSEGVRFREHNPPTRLGSVDGKEVCPNGHRGGPRGVCGVLVDPCDTGPIMIDGSPPDITCPEILSGDASDCGRSTRRVTWDPISATDNCDSGVSLICSIGNSLGFAVGHLLSKGGVFPRGATFIQCAARDKCGNVTECNFAVRNSGKNRLLLDIEQPSMLAAGPLTRGIDLRAFDCTRVPPNPTVSSCVDVTFGAPDHIPGFGLARLNVPPANYVCVDARDPLHTLRSTCELTCEEIDGEGQVWTALFEGAPDVSDECHGLIGGNLNGLDADGFARVDIVDHVTFQMIESDDPAPGADTACGVAGPHGDLTGDGIVDMLDHSVILDNMFREDSLGCAAMCSSTGVVTPTLEPRSSITLTELADMGLLQAGRTADLNFDGVVDLTDVALYVGQGGPAASGGDVGRERLGEIRRGNKGREALDR